MIKQIIENCIWNSSIPEYERYDRANKQEVVDLLSVCWKLYYEDEDEMKFNTVELRDLWFWVKMRILEELTKRGDSKSARLMSRELNANSRKMQNREYAQQSIYEV